MSNIKLFHRSAGQATELHGIAVGGAEIDVWGGGRLGE